MNNKEVAKMNKKFAAIIVFGLTMTTCASPAIGEVRTNQTVTYDSQINNSGMISMLKEQKAKQTKLEQEAQLIKDLQKNTLMMKQALKNLNKHVQKTWYVFSGSTPQGWDCSGLVLWFYKHFDVELEHSATKQKFSGEFVDSPQLGDIVAFSHKGYDSAYHNGIYVGEGMFIHAPKVGALTKISSIADYAGEHSTISYTRINY